MVRDAETHADEDKKLRAVIEARNESDTLIYSIEKMIKDNESKIEAGERQAIENAIAELRKAMESEDAEVIRQAKSSLEQASHKFAERIYQESAQQQGGPAPGGPEQQGQGAQDQGAGQQENVYDADYEVVDDDNQK